MKKNGKRNLTITLPRGKECFSLANQDIDQLHCRDDGISAL